MCYELGRRESGFELSKQYLIETYELGRDPHLGLTVYSGECAHLLMVRTGGTVRPEQILSCVRLTRPVCRVFIMTMLLEWNEGEHVLLSPPLRRHHYHTPSFLRRVPVRSDYLFSRKKYRR